MTNDKRVNPGIPAGGQFAAHDHAEAIVSLPEPQPVTVSLVSTVVLNGHGSDLPAYPAGLSEPKISFTYGDDHPGVLYTTVEATDESGSEGSVMVWIDEDGDTGDSVSNSEEPTGWDESLDDEIIEWAHSVSERIDQAASQVNRTSLADAEKAIIANALGKAYTDPNALVWDGSISEVSTARTEKFLTAWGDLPADAEIFDRDSAVRDVLTDLRHYATTHKLDFYTILGGSLQVYIEECELDGL